MAPIKGKKINPLKGALAGFAATIPMSVAMGLMYRQLPLQERYPLPPHQITAQIIDENDSPEHQMMTFIGHFSYGAGAGAVYTLAFSWIPLPTIVKGIMFGFAVWYISYLGWLPALRILPPATQHPPRRNFLMIAAHFIWGSTMALIAETHSR